MSSKKLTPEETRAMTPSEIARKVYPTREGMVHWKAIALEEGIKQCIVEAVAEKEAQLKEATDLLDECKDAFEYLDAYPSIVKNIDLVMNHKTTGSEAGSHEATNN